MVIADLVKVSVWKASVRGCVSVSFGLGGFVPTSVREV